MYYLTLADSFATLCETLREKGCRCASLLLKARYHKRYNNPDAPGNFIAWRESAGMLSFLPSNRECIYTPDRRWARQGRQDMKPAKLIRALLAPRLVKVLKDTDLAEFATHFKAAEAAESVRIEETDFESAYNSDNYKDGDQFGSCMRDENVGPFYRKCGAKVLVAIRGDDNYCGRAILWPAVHGLAHGVTAPFMDRIYSHGPEIEQLFKDYAKEHGYWHKSRQRNSDYSFANPDGESLERSGAFVTPARSVHDCEFYPYLDTFRWQDSDGDLCCHGRKGDATYIYNDTDGNREDANENRVQDDYGNWIDRDDAVKINGSWYDVNGDDVVTCHRSGEYILASEAYTIRLSTYATITIHEQYVDAP